MFIESNSMMISLSSGNTASLIVSFVDSFKDPYVFKVLKVYFFVSNKLVEKYDFSNFNRVSNTIVTINNLLFCGSF
jgi:hypothetical protein